MNQMPYIIDGHNLIPKLPGLSLDEIDDETKLISMLQEFCRLERKQAEVFFDNSPPGSPKARVYGVVTARFIRQESSADDAIRLRLQRLGRSARNWTVVSSDQAIQAAARVARSQFISSEVFANKVVQQLEERSHNQFEEREKEMDEGELEEWLRMFDANEGETQI